MTDLLTFDAFVDAGLPLVKQQAGNKWVLGDLAAMMEIKVGRPDDPGAPTLTDLARAWDVDLPRVSEWRNVARFFPSPVRTFPLSWSHYNAARRAAQKAHKDDEYGLEWAQARLIEALDLHMGIRAFRDHLNGVYLMRTIMRTDNWNSLKADVPEQDAYAIILKRAKDAKKKEDE